MSRGAKDAKLSNEIEVSGAQNDKTRVKAVSDLTAEEILNEPKELRVIRRAKRTTKDAESVKSSAVKSAFTNCQRRPRNRHRKSKLGEPKKGGGGGKGVWGKIGSEVSELGDCSDVRDPNYDSDNQGDYKLVAKEVKDEDWRKAVNATLREYLEHGNCHEVEESLYDMNISPQCTYIILLMAVELGLERHNNHRELISQLISELYNNVLSEQDIVKGFEDLLKRIVDLRLDTPDAPNLIGQFIARCIADDCLAPKFVSSYTGKIDNEYLKEALDKAHVLITMKQGMSHLDNIWGMGGGNRPVKYLTNKMVALLKEYTFSGDKQEALRCLNELEVPHFHHELVYQALDMAIEVSTVTAMDAMVALIRFLSVETVVITLDQFEKGIRRILADLGDISLDVPNAHTLFETIAVKLKTQKVLSDVLYEEMSQRGRKRFVSEGDGGRVKV